MKEGSQAENQGQAGTGTATGDPKPRRKRATPKFVTFGKAENQECGKGTDHYFVCSSGKSKEHCRQQIIDAAIAGEFTTVCIHEQFKTVERKGVEVVRE
jgi:hypothetical protein